MLPLSWENSLLSQLFTVVRKNVGNLWILYGYDYLQFNGSKRHGNGCTTVLSGMYRFLYHVYCLTPPTSLFSDNTQNLHSSMERIPKQCPHPTPKVNVLATHQALKITNSHWLEFSISVPTTLLLFSFGKNFYRIKRCALKWRCFTNTIITLKIVTLYILIWKFIYKKCGRVKI